MTPAAILVCALLLDAFLGEPDWLWRKLPHPAVLMGRFVAWLDARFNSGDQRRLKGAFCAALLVLTGVLLGWVLTLTGPLTEIGIAAVLIAQRSLAEHVAAVAKGLRQSLEDGRKAVAMIVSRDTSAMDHSGVARAAIESGAENLSDGVIAPAFWFLIGGLPGLIAYKIVNTADSMIGYRTERYERFGWAAARTDDLLNLIPARLTSALIAAVGGIADWRGILADARLHRSPNAGWPEAAMSRALDAALSGPRAYDGRLQDFAWVNAMGRRHLTVADIDASIAMLWKAWALMLALLCLGIVLF